MPFSIIAIAFLRFYVFFYLVTFFKLTFVNSKHKTAFNNVTLFLNLVLQIIFLYFSVLAYIWNV